MFVCGYFCVARDEKKTRGATTTIIIEQDYSQKGVAYIEQQQAAGS